MTVITRSTYISRAETWAQSLWDTAETHWTKRTGQDKNYRSRVIHPQIVGIIEDMVKGPSRNILDLGCGDGVLASDKHCRALIGPDGQYLGVDINSSLLGCADCKQTNETLSFLRMNLTDPALPVSVRRNGIDWNVVVSVFVVQEIADIGAFFSNLAGILNPQSHAIIVTVHPRFAEWLKAHRRLKVDESLSGNSLAPWRWAGQYPIVDEHQGTFHLPHFHRTLDDYHTLASGVGLIVRRTVDIPDTPAQLAAYCDEGFAPFRDYPENLYWPAIGEISSSVAMIIEREDTGA